MDYMRAAILLGIVEGLTEFIPVSSTGHLVVAGHLLKFRGDTAATFEIFIQLGAILAIVVLERRRFRALLRPSGGARAAAPGGFAGARGCMLLALTTFPALLAGYLLHDGIKTLFAPATVAWGLGAGGAGILLVERFRRAPRVESVDAIGPREAIVIGLFQCLSLWPGVSRSGATIVGGLLVGLDRKPAASYSFLAAVPVMMAATSYELYTSFDRLAAADAAPFAVGFVVSFVCAWASARWLIAFLGRHTLRPFAWYRLAVAPAVYWLVK